MQKIAKFEKVTAKEFKKAWRSIFPDVTDEKLEDIYDELDLPKRATVGSAGYDFFAPDTIKLNAGEAIVIPTGIRAKIKNGWVLKLYPRSGLGFKHQIQLSNTVGIIDSDYYHSDNEGHIMIKLVNRSLNNSALTVEKGQGFAQGIFLEYGITEDDEVDGIRNGGFGSTTK